MRLKELEKGRGWNRILLGSNRLLPLNTAEAIPSNVMFLNGGESDPKSICHLTAVL